MGVLRVSTAQKETIVTTDNWIALFSVVATLLAPMLKILLEHTLRKSKSKDKTARKYGADIKAPRPLWVKIADLSLYLLPGAALVIQAYSAVLGEPVTKFDTFVISLSVASLFFLASIEFFMQITMRLLDAMTKSLELHVRQLDLSEKVLTTLEKNKKVKVPRRT